LSPTLNANPEFIFKAEQIHNAIAGENGNVDPLPFAATILSGRRLQTAFIP
jgi:hypothetical protein